MFHVNATFNVCVAKQHTHHSPLHTRYCAASVVFVNFVRAAGVRIRKFANIVVCCVHKMCDRMFIIWYEMQKMPEQESCSARQATAEEGERKMKQNGAQFSFHPSESLFALSFCSAWHNSMSLWHTNRHRRGQGVPFVSKWWQKRMIKENLCLCRVLVAPFNGFAWAVERASYVFSIWFR